MFRNFGTGFASDVQNGLFPDASKAAMGPLNQIPGTITPYFKPYTDAGASALPGYQDMMHQLMSNPQDFMSKLGQGYQQSPGYNFAVQQGQQGINNAAASGGMLGTPQHEQESAAMNQGLANQDYGNYMDNIMKIFNVGQSGTGGLITQGAASSSDLASSLAQALAGKSGLQYAGQANQNNQTGNLLNGIMSMFGKMGMGA